MCKELCRRSPNLILRHSAQGKHQIQLSFYSQFIQPEEAELAEYGQQVAPKSVFSGFL